VVRKPVADFVTIPSFRNVITTTFFVNIMKTFVQEFHATVAQKDKGALREASSVSVEKLPY
jgi:Asp-tRNA(Asn)/Glu-tRNA(Gln) amidotransferase B subunit